MKIGIGNDHTAVEMKKVIKVFLEEKGYEVIDYGTDTTEAFDYPVSAKAVAMAVTNNEADLGILICGTGVGMSLAANKVKGIRATACCEPLTARLSKEHNNTNILTFGARIIGTEMAKTIVTEWLDAKFQGERHQKRVDMITDIENTN